MRSFLKKPPSSKSIDRSTWLIILIELTLVVFSLSVTALIHWFYPLDAFRVVLFGYILFSLGTLLVLRGILATKLLVPGIYTTEHNPQVIRAWQIFNYLAMNNLFFHYQNGLMPPILRKFFSRMLGSKIGSGLISIAGPLIDQFLITLGKNTMVGQDAILNPTSYDGHVLVMGTIHIGEGLIVGARSVVSKNVVIGKNSLVKAMSLVEEGTRIGDNEIWGGIPARKMGEVTVEDTPQRFDDTVYMGVCVLT